MGLASGFPFWLSETRYADCFSFMRSRSYVLLPWCLCTASRLNRRNLAYLAPLKRDILGTKSLVHAWFPRLAWLSGCNFQFSNKFDNIPLAYQLYVSIFVSVSKLPSQSYSFRASFARSSTSTAFPREYDATSCLVVRRL